MISEERIFLDYSRAAVRMSSAAPTSQRVVCMNYATSSPLEAGFAKIYSPLFTHWNGMNNSMNMSHAYEILHVSDGLLWYKLDPPGPKIIRPGPGWLFEKTHRGPRRRRWADGCFNSWRGSVGLRRVHMSSCPMTSDSAEMSCGQI